MVDQEGIMQARELEGNWRESNRVGYLEEAASQITRKATG